MVYLKINGIQLRIISLLFIVFFSSFSYSQITIGEYGKENGYNVSSLYKSSLYKVERNRLYGVIDSLGNVVVPVEYRWVYLPTGHLENGKPVVFVKSRRGYHGAYLYNGMQLLQCKYTSITADFDFKTKVIGGYMVSRGNYEGYCDKDGNTIISPSVYTKVTKYGDGFSVRIGGSHGFCGYVDKSGKEIIPPNKYSKVLYLGYGYYDCKLNGKSVLCDATGKELFRTKYTGLSGCMYNGQKCLMTYLGDQRGVIDLKGNVIKPITPKVYERKRVEKNFTYYDVISEEGLWGIKNESGEFLIPCNYDMIYFSDTRNLFRVVKNEYCGVFSKEGKVIIPVGKYHDIVEHDDGFTVYYADSEGFCDLDGRELIPVNMYDDIVSAGDIFYVRKGDYKGVVGRNGETIVPIKYTKVSKDSYYGKLYYEIYLDDKVGLCDNSGNEIIPPVYDAIGPTAFNKPFNIVFVVKSGNRQGLVDGDTGNLIFPAEEFERVDILPYVVKDGYYISASVGNRKCTFDLKGNLLSDSNLDEQWNHEFEAGQRLFDEGEYLKAADAYLRAVRIRKDEIAFFNIGASYYNAKKYTSAIDNLELCLRMGPSSNIRDKAVSLINNSRDFLNRRNNERRQKVCSVIGGFLNIGLSIYQNVQMQKMRKANPGSATAGIYDDDDSSSDSGGVSASVPGRKSWRCMKCGANRTECLVCNGEGHYFSIGGGIPREVKCEHCNGTKVCPRSRD